MSNPTLNILERPHEGTAAHPGGQVAVIQACLAFAIVVAAFGRAFGKSVTALFLLLEEGGTRFPGQVYEFAYCAPFLRQSREVYRAWKQVFGPLVVWHSDVDMILKLAPWGTNRGAVVRFFGLDEYDNIRSPRVHRIVVDEVKDVAPEAIWNVLMPMLLGREGGGILLQGTPSRFGKGAVMFRQEFSKGQDPTRFPHHKSITAPSMGNPYLDAKQLAILMAACPDERAVQEEIYARFLEDEGAVFGNLGAVFTVPVLRTEGQLWIGEDPDKGDKQRRPDKYAVGLDVGRVNDATVAKVFNRRTRRQAALLRMIGEDQHVQRAQIAALRDRYNRATVYYDDTGGYGWAVAGDLAREAAVGFVGRTWTQAQKESDITHARFLCQNAGAEVGGRGWYLLDVPWVRAEFEAYQAVTTTGDGRQLARAQYGAPAGLHDDAVAAACLVAEQLTLPYVPDRPRETGPAEFTPEWFDHEDRPTIYGPGKLGPSGSRLPFRIPRR